MRALLLLALISSAAAAQTRVEPRVFVKEHHLFVSGGATFLERNDYWTSPGGSFSAVYYPGESNGFELRGAFFASRLDGAAEEVAAATGLRPDAQKPVALLLGGWRHSLTYGKVAIGSGVVHFDVQSGLYAGTLITDAAMNPALSGAAGVVARIGSNLFAQLDLALLLSREQRSTSTITVGALPMLSFGFSL
jgi:hypothetical protein